MSVVFHQYRSPAGITEEYFRLRAFFLKRRGDDFSFGRWDWMITHGWLDHEALQKIGVWEDDGEIIGVATFDTRPGEGFICVLHGYEHLRAEMVRYAANYLKNKDSFRLLVADADSDFQETALQQGFVPTPDKEFDAVFHTREPDLIQYPIEPGFRIISLEESFDVEKYGQVLWKGFNHEIKGEGPLVLSQAKRKQLLDEMLRPNVDLSLKIAVVAPNGDYASYCGMWLDAASPDALVEPVATDPAYRKLGLGRAAVLEGVRRCGLRGAKRALVASNQQFYYSIGFVPLNTYTWWRQK